MDDEFNFHIPAPTIQEATLNLLRAFGHDVILTPDNEILFIEDSPAIEYPDGRMLDNYGRLME